MIDRMLARLSETPVNTKGTHAYDVVARVNGDDVYTALFTHDELPTPRGEQIRKTLFTEYPEAVDYSFREFSYRELQKRTIARKAFGFLGFYAAYASAGEIEIDEY